MPRYCQKMSDGYVYPFTETLAARPDMKVIYAEPHEIVGGHLHKKAAPAEPEPEPDAEEAPQGTAMGDDGGHEESPWSQFDQDPEGLDTDNMTKDDLERYARREYGAELDKRYRRDVLRKQVRAMHQGLTPQEAMTIKE